MNSAIDVRMDYAMVEEMSSAFTDAARQIEETIAEINQVVGELQNEVLVGDTGTALTEALRNDLCSSLKRIQDKMTELAGDTIGAVRIMRDGDREARSRFM